MTIEHPDVLLDCPFCGSSPVIAEMRYINTGCLYGFRLECPGCSLKIKEQPACWPAGKRNEEMMESKTTLIARWNRRNLNTKT